MDRLDLELYADRLARHASRLADELAAARLRLTWAALERDARVELGAGRSLLLESLGVLAQADASGADEALLARRREQLDALAALQVYVERCIERVALGPGAG
jgi:predicted ATPase